MRKYLFFVFILTLYACNQNKDNKEIYPEIVESDTNIVINQHIDLLYGLSMNRFKVKEGKVKSNQTLAGLLSETGISGSEVHNLINLSEKVFDSRKFKRGNSYFHFIPEIDTLSSYFIYEIDKVEFLKFAIGDSLYVDRLKKKTDTITKYAAFSISNSLWMTMKDKELNPILANELSEIYAWTIDFFGLQKGDSVRIVYDEIMVDNQSIGIDKIHAAYFRHINHDYYAIAFKQEGKLGYFDLEGNSLKKAFLKAPLRYSRISSRFSHSRLHPILKIRRPHHGVDYAAAIGTPVQTIGDGTVISVTHTNGAGRMVKIKHNSVYTSAYLHLRGYGKGIKKGAHVSQGQIIGYVGSSGLSTGPHLDFRIYKNGGPIDPLKIKSPPVEPIKTINVPSFNEKIYLSLKQLKIEQSFLASEKFQKEDVF